MTPSAYAMSGDAPDCRRPCGSRLRGLSEPDGPLRDAMARHLRTFLLLLTCPADGSILCTPAVRRAAFCSTWIPASARRMRTGEQRLEWPLRLHVLPPVVRLQPVRRSGTLLAASRQCPQRRQMGRRAHAGRSALQGKVSRIYFRADAGFANPEVYEYLEAEASDAIRLPKNNVLQERIGYLLTRPVGRPPNHVRRSYANFHYQAGSFKAPSRRRQG